MSPPRKRARPGAGARSPREASATGRRRPSGARIILLASRFNRPITEALVEGAQGTLRRAGFSPRRVRTLWVPGCFELPVAAARLARGRGRPEGIVALGCLIRGETRQYAVIAEAVARGLMEVSVREAMPVGFGVLVAQTPSQAWARAGGRMNRGAEAASAVLDVLKVR